MLVYAEDVLKGKPGNLRTLEEWKGGNLLLLDPATQRNLEVFKTTAHTRTGSLLDVMDETSSAAGSRLLGVFSALPKRSSRNSTSPSLRLGICDPSHSGGTGFSYIKIRK